MAETATQSPELKTYYGNCHCGAFKFNVKVPEITSVTECKCSICFKKGYKWIFPGAHCFEIEKGEGTLTGYEFGQKVMTHNFCPTCGTAIYGRRKGVEPGMDIVVNARALRDFDIWFPKAVGSLYDTLSREPQYISPKFTGTEPAVKIENANIYTGGCHCGAVTVALKTEKPLTEDPNETISECDCSICGRNGTILIYPVSDQMSISDPSNKLTPYIFGQHLQSHEFCSVCGINVYIKKLSVPADQFKKWEGDKDQKEWEKECHANLRCFYSLDWDRIKVGRDSWKNSEPRYEVPA